MFVFGKTWRALFHETPGFEIHSFALLTTKLKLLTAFAQSFDVGVLKGPGQTCPNAGN